MREESRELVEMEDKAVVAAEALATRQQKQVLLFYCVEMEDVARKIASESPFIQLQSINWRYTLVFFPFFPCFDSFVLKFQSLSGIGVKCVFLGEIPPLCRMGS